jgi:small subunit ribosomal protein S11
MAKTTTKKSQSNKTITTKKSKSKLKFPIVKIYLKANFNNSIISITDMEGNVLTWSSSGKVGFKGTKKSTPFASQKATEEIIEKAKAMDVSTVHLVINGAGMGRDSFIRAMQNTDFEIATITDTTGFPFGGVRARKRRRV